MVRKRLKRFLPTAETIRKQRNLKWLGKPLQNPNLWHLNRRSIAKATSIGLFVSFLPFPGHMITAAMLAILVHANLPIAIALVWVSNPFTIPAMLYLSYKVGVLVLDRPVQHFHFEASFKWFAEELNSIGAPLLIGSFICGIVAASLGNIVVRLFWRYHVAIAWAKRSQKPR